MENFGTFWKTNLCMGKIHMVLACHMWVEFVVGSHPCYEKFLSRYTTLLQFYPLFKNQHFMTSNIWCEMVNKELNCGQATT